MDAAGLGRVDAGARSLEDQFALELREHERDLPHCAAEGRRRVVGLVKEHERAVSFRDALGEEHTVDERSCGAIEACHEYDVDATLVDESHQFLEGRPRVDHGGLALGELKRRSVGPTQSHGFSQSCDL